MQHFKNSGVSPAIYLQVLLLVLKKKAVVGDLVFVYRVYEVKPEMPAVVEEAFVKRMNATLGYD